MWTRFKQVGGGDLTTDYEVVTKTNFQSQFMSSSTLQLSFSIGSKDRVACVEVKEFFEQDDHVNWVLYVFVELGGYHSIIISLSYN